MCRRSVLLASEQVVENQSTERKKHDNERPQNLVAGRALLASEHLYQRDDVKDHDNAVSRKANAWELEKHSFLKACQEVGIEASLEELETFMRGAIEGREYAKFVFSKNLSLAIEAMTEYGESLGLDREIVSHISWGELYKSGDMELDDNSIAEHLPP